MLIVIFEVWPHEEHRQRYLDIAAELRPELMKIDGFIRVERFSSLTEEGKMLSLSFWRDEDAIARWRAHAEHQQAQKAGIFRLFRDYRITVAESQRSWKMDERNYSQGN